MTSPRDSSPARSCRRAAHAATLPVTRVNAIRAAVRPPTPSRDQFTAKKTRAAASRQMAPRASRIFGHGGAGHARSNGGCGQVPAVAPAGAARGAARQRVDARSHRGASCVGAELLEQTIGLDQGREELGCDGTPEHQPAGVARDAPGGQRRTAVGAAQRVGVARHGTI